MRFLRLASLAVVFCLFTPGLALAKQWGGAGPNALASNPANWIGGVAPLPGELVQFDGINPTKGCVWDIPSSSFSLKMTAAFSSSVVAAVDLQLIYADISGGLFDMGPFEVRISSNFIQTAGISRASNNGTVVWEGTTLQTVRMTSSSYFFNFRVAGSSTVRALTDLFVDGSFNFSSGEFELRSFTLTMTGGTQVSVGGSSSLFWDDTAGLFRANSGVVLFNSQARPYQINQGLSNVFNNLTVFGSKSVDVASTMTVAGPLIVGQLGGSSQLNLGANTVNLKGDVVVTGATLALKNSVLNVQCNRVDVNTQGVIQIQPTGVSRLVFNQNSLLNFSQGTLLIQSDAVFTSSSPGITRFRLDINGPVDIQQPTLFESMDSDGFHMGPSAIPLNLKTMSFAKGMTGGVALNFEPVTLASVTVESAQFDVSIATNIRAIFNAGLLPKADINVVSASGTHAGSNYETDPSGIVHWGVLGKPLNFSGFSLGISSIVWSWTVVNNPLDLVLKDSQGVSRSPTLTPDTTFWIETGLSTNTVYTRLVEASADGGVSDSDLVSRRTLATRPLNGVFLNVGVSSITFTWDPNTNPDDTLFIIEQSTDGVLFSEKASGPFSTLNPYSDMNLTSQKNYFYRIKSENGDGIVNPQPVQLSTVTLPIPPPRVDSLIPPSAQNLGKTNFTLTGKNFQNGATLIFKHTGSSNLLPSSLVFVDPFTLTGTVNLTGIFANTWDIQVVNPDGQVSVGSGAGLFTVSNAPSTGDISSQNYSSTTPTTFTTTDGNSSLTFSAGAMADGRVYISEDPLNSPLSVDPILIETANGKLFGMVPISGGMIEILAFTNAGLFTIGFSGTVTLSIKYPDQDGDGILDNLSIRASSLRLMTLNETTQSWDPITTATVDLVHKRIQATLSHFSVYGIFGAQGSIDLSQAKIFPNPWKPGSAGRFDNPTLGFSNLTQEGVIRLYTLTGTLVKKIDYGAIQAGSVSWDGQDSNGELVPSGVYLVQIESTHGEKRMFKLGLER